VKQRAILAALGALLLALPFMVLVTRTLFPALPATEDGGRRISPMLDSEARARLRTYRRDCGSGQPCEPPLGCVTDLRILAQYCTDSECTTDTQCPAGQVCREIDTADNGPSVRFCVPAGKRHEGEHCFKLPLSQETACAAGLACGGKESWCARPCLKDGARGCAEGFFCADTTLGPLCLPTCEARGCPGGQSCVRHQEGASACAEIYGPNCQQSPCPAGRECNLGQDPARPGKVWMECIERCGEGYPPCTSGLACDGWVCRAPCNPADPSPCMKGYVCRQHRPERPWVCRPDSQDLGAR
jgi:hypothetical protein